MSLLFAHLEQISYSCQGIDTLQLVARSPTPRPPSLNPFNSFPPPKIFTNALLSNHDITSLIRDTEAHERALFSVPPPPPPPSASLRSPEPGSRPSTNRRQTVFSVAEGEVTAAVPARGSSHPRRRTAVAAVLGGDMHEQLRPDRPGDVDVDVLLRGAEKLCGVYELPGARERIAALGSRYRNAKNTAAYYEARVADQAEQLAGINKGWLDGDDDEEQPRDDESELWTEADLRREEDEAREMELKKKELQARLRAMEKDLGGLMNM